MTEAQLQAAIVELALTTRWLYFHDYDSRCNNAGFPDLVMCHKDTGKVLICELKAGKGRMRPEQLEWQKSLLKGRNNYRLWTPKEWLSGEIEQELMREYMDAH